MSLISRLTTCLALGLLALPAAAQNPVSYFGVSHATHQAQFDALWPQGYRMTSLAVSGDLDNARYTAVWRQMGGAPWVASHGMNYNQYATQAGLWESQGYRAQLVAASGADSKVVFAAVWIADGADAKHYLDNTLPDYSQQTQRNQGRRLSSFAPYRRFGSDYHVVVYEPNPERFAWGVEILDDGAAFGHKFNELSLGHARPRRIATTEDARYTHLWTDDRVGAWYAVAGRNVFEIAADRDHYQGLGLHMTDVSARGTGAAARYGAIFQERLVPYTRSFTRTGQAVPELAHFDTFVEDLMVAERIRNASLAVTRNGRLVYARGFTYAEPGSFVTQPTTPFRLGSISKPLTGTLIHDLVSRNIGGFNLGTSLVGYLGITNHHAAAPQATIRRLLRHISGIRDNFSEADARTWWMNTYSPPLVFMPLDESIIVQYACTRTFDPINTYRYSNVGYTALGQVIEQATGQSYMTALRDRLFAPVDTAALYQQRPRPADQAPGEAPYFLRACTLEPSNIHSDFRLLANQYAREYWDSAGGTVSSAMVLARAIAGAYCIGDASPTLLPAARASALTHFTDNDVDGNPIQTTDAGWRWNDMGNGRTRYTHNGSTDGFGARVVFTSDGLCIVLLTNMSGVTSTGGALVTEADAVTNWPTHDLFPNYGMPTFPNTVDLGTPYCSGDGSGTACPCGNVGNPGNGCANRTFAQGARLNATGVSPSISQDSLTLRVTRSAPLQPGLFYQGTTATNGGAGAPFGDGLRCAGGFVVRLQVRTANFIGTASSTISVPTAGGVLPGQTRRYQWWYRDPGSSPCATEFNTSNGLTITWVP